MPSSENDVDVDRLKRTETMSNSNEQPPKRKTKRQRQLAMYERMGMETPEAQALDFNRRYLSNWMRKQHGETNRRDSGTSE